MRTRQKRKKTKPKHAHEDEIASLQASECGHWLCKLSGSGRLDQERVMFLYRRVFGESAAATGDGRPLFKQRCQNHAAGLRLPESLSVDPEDSAPIEVPQFTRYNTSGCALRLCMILSLHEVWLVRVFPGLNPVIKPGPNTSQALTLYTSAAFFLS